MGSTTPRRIVTGLGVGQKQSAPQEDYSFKLNGGFTMSYDVVSAVYNGGYKIDLTFDDGKNGVVDFAKYLERGGVFKKFKDIEFFKNFTVNKELGVITWNNEIDVAPETLYSEATKSSLPYWMQ